MLEVEMKFPIDDDASLPGKLRSLGAEIGEERTEVDHYFNAPDRDFARTDEALRLRRIGEQNLLTYKGPKRDLQTKTRTELEIGLDAGAAAAEKMTALLTHLGYRAVATVSKRRCTWRLRRGNFDVEVCLDEVQEVGRFMELEIVAPEAALDQARQAVQDLAHELGLSGTERRSYLEMWLAKHHGA